MARADSHTRLRLTTAFTVFTCDACAAKERFQQNACRGSSIDQTSKRRSSRNQIYKDSVRGSRRLQLGRGNVSAFPHMFAEDGRCCGSFPCGRGRSRRYFVEFLKNKDNFHRSFGLFYIFVHFPSFFTFVVSFRCFSLPSSFCCLCIINGLPGRKRERERERYKYIYREGQPSRPKQGQTNNASKRDADYEHAGVAIAVHKKWVKLIEEVRELSGRNMTIILKTGSGDLALTATYGPTAEASDKKQKSLLGRAIQRWGKTKTV